MLRWFFAWCLTLSWALVLQQDCVADEQPNIVLIMADDFGYECVGANGGLSYPTPEIDRIASEGVRFTHCYSQPLCTPTRVQLMTGLYNFRNYTRFGELAADQKTFGHFLGKAGYATCLAHKWQLGAKKPDHFGFDEYAIHQPCRSHWGQPIIRNGQKTQLAPDVYGPDYFAEFVEGFIERHQKQPFFVYFPIWLTHEPFDATPDSDEPSGRLDRKYFGDMVRYLDKIVGRIDTKLSECGLQENTLFIVTGDNGTVKGIETQTKDGLIIGGKSKLTNAGTHVPLIVKWPGQIAPDTVSRDLVDFTDFVPTLADAANVALPEDIPFDGRSFLPRITGGKAKPRQWVYLSLDPRKPNKSVPFAKRRTVATVGPIDWCVRNERWKLYHDGRFYDLEADPFEKQPLSLETPFGHEVPSARQSLAKVLAQFPDLRRK